MNQKNIWISCEFHHYKTSLLNPNYHRSHLSVYLKSVCSHNSKTYISLIIQVHFVLITYRGRHKIRCMWHLLEGCHVYVHPVTATYIPLCTPRNIHPILCQLHWLPIRYRIQFKILALVFLCINDLAPSYLQELLVQYRPSRNLRSQSKSLLVSPRINTQFYGARSFQSSAPELWNNIPDKIKTSKTIDQFKAALKTHYFMLNNWVI